jgi:hypothetical protein
VTWTVLVLLALASLAAGPGAPQLPRRQRRAERRRGPYYFIAYGDSSNAYMRAAAFARAAG